MNVMKSVCQHVGIAKLFCHVHTRNLEFTNKSLHTLVCCVKRPFKRTNLTSVVNFQVPGLGHIPNIVKSMSSSNDGVIKSAVQVVHLLSANDVRLAPT